MRLVRHDDEARVNPTLLQMLEKDFAIRVPELAAGPIEDESGLDIPTIWNVIRKAIREMKGWEVSEKVVLSTFSFSKYLMWKDLTERLDQIKANRLVRHLLEKPREPYSSNGSLPEPASVDVKPRGAIKTPWVPSRPDELCVVYTLSEVRAREHPIPIYHGMRWFRWASRLSLSRAREGSELYLETEPEWRLYDELKAKGITFCLRPDDPKVPDPDDPRGRAVFEVGTWRIRYAGAAGFRMVSGKTTVYEPSVKRVIERIME